MNKKVANEVAIGLIILVAIVIGGVFWVQNEKKASMSLYENTPTESRYSNSTFGYEFIYKKPWRIASELSKQYSIQTKISSIGNKKGCADIVEQNDLQNCYAKILKNNESSNEIIDYEKSWNIQNTDVLVLTDFSKQQEEEFLKSVHDNKKSILDFPATHAIQIFPVSVGGLCEKEVSRPDKNMLVRNIDLNNGYKACENDLRKPEFVETSTISDSSSLFILIPHEINYEISTGGKMSGLNFKIVAGKNSPLYQTLIDIVNSLKFN